MSTFTFLILSTFPVVNGFEIVHVNCFQPRTNISSSGDLLYTRIWFDQPFLMNEVIEMDLEFDEGATGFALFINDNKDLVLSFGVTSGTDLFVDGNTVQKINISMPRITLRIKSMNNLFLLSDDTKDLYLMEKKSSSLATNLFSTVNVFYHSVKRTCQCRSPYITSEFAGKCLGLF